jgi:Protein involved in formate dehydrogenase formation
VTTTKLVRDSAPTGIADDLRPLLRLHDELAQFRLTPARVRRARANVAAGRVAFDATEVIRAAGNLDPHLGRMATAFEMCGLASARELEAVRGEYAVADALITAWLAGERGAPNDRGRRMALRAASLVANAVLRSAAAQSSKGTPFTHWKQTTCPCCGGAPDIAVRAAGTRWLLCARCDTKWVSPTAGCLGCEATRPPTFVRVDAPDLGYELLVCHACARYMKERSADGMHSPLVERAVTVELDAAAERRGLRI